MSSIIEQPQLPVPFAPTRDELLWLAGLLEGEGSFDTQKGTYARIRLAMTDRDIVVRAATIMGTTVRVSLNRAPVSSTWHTELQGDRAAEIMERLLPFMGTRRSRKILEALATHRSRTLPSGRAWSAPGPRLEMEDVAA